MRFITANQIFSGKEFLSTNTVLALNDNGLIEDITIKELAELVSFIIGYDGDIEHDLSKPDGTPRKLMDSTKIQSLGWKPKISLENGIKSVYKEVMQKL